MRGTTILAGILVIAAAGVGLPGPARAASVNIGVQTDSVSLGIQIGSPPPLVVVPGTIVYSAPSLPYNYFVYSGHYYLFHEGMWLTAASYNGPWTVIALERVPRPILAVPVEYYKRPPGHWEKHGPPPWARAYGHDKDMKGHGRKEHGKKKWEDRD